MKALSKENALLKMHIGQRMIKTAVAVYICFLIYLMRGERGIPFYSAIAAILCMQANVESSGKVAINRIIGTLIGAFYGTVVLTAFYYKILDQRIVYIVISIFIIFVIKTSIEVKKPQIAYFSCVVFLSITANHIYDQFPYYFILDRVTDTCIGVGVSLMINSVGLPRNKQKHILFVSGLDDTLLGKGGSLTNYSKVELNRMITEGANFTVATERTPAAVIETLKDVNLKLPVIVMNGAAVYDIKEKKYVHKVPFERGTTDELIRMLEEDGLDYSANVIIQDVLLIFCNAFKNNVMQDIYQRLRTSPYRNYIYGSKPEGEAVYFYIIEETEKIKSFIKKLETATIYENLRYVIGNEAEYPNCTYVKIYNRKATKGEMIGCLQERIGTSKLITYGSIEGMYDVVIKNGDDNLVVKSMKRAYKPYRKLFKS